MRRGRVVRHPRLRVTKPGERRTQVGIGCGVAMLLQFYYDLVEPGRPNLGPLLDLLEQLIQRPRRITGAIAVAPPL
jgi:hypothetical protein